MTARKSKRDWVEGNLKPALRRFPERQEKFKTSSGIEVEPLYTPEDLEGQDYSEKVGYPGEYRCLANNGKPLCRASD